MKKCKMMLLRKHGHTPSGKLTENWRGILLLAVLLMPSIAAGNAGTPLMWVGFLHLFFGNFFLGIAEAVIAVVLFRLPGFLRIIGIFILANFVSMFAGMGALLIGQEWGAALLRNSSNPLSVARNLLYVAPVVAFILTLVVEWPFCYWAARPNKSMWRSIRIDAAVQSISYMLLIFPVYYWVSFASALTKTQLEPNASFVRPPLAWIYYLEHEGGSVWKMKTDGSHRNKVVDRKPVSEYEKLVIDHGTTDGLFSLLVSSERGQDETTSTLLQDFTTSAALRGDRGTYYDPFTAADLQSSSSAGTRWEASTGSWAAEGLKYWKSGEQQPGAMQYIAVETPFFAWRSSDATILPSGQIVYQLFDYIVLFDPVDRRITTLARGQSPVVALEPR